MVSMGVPLKLGVIPIQNPNFMFGAQGHPVNCYFLSVLLSVVDAAIQGIFWSLTSILSLLTLR